MMNIRFAAIALALFVGSRVAHAQATFPGLVFASIGGKDLKLDLYIPAVGHAPYPLAIHIHGGAWSAGSRAEVPQYGAALLAQGFAVASIDYRLTSQAGQYGAEPVTFPAQIHDVKGAVRWLRANAATYQLDTTRFASLGTSAGGHLSELLALSGGSVELEGTIGGNAGVSSAVQAAVSYFGPSDLLQMNNDVTMPPGSTLDHDAAASPESRLLGWSGPGQGLGDIKAHLSDPNPPYPALVNLARQASPVTWADVTDPPMFLAHGTSDTTVPTNQSTRLSAALFSVGVVHELRDLPGIGHGFGGGAIDIAAVAFLKEHLVGPARPVPGTAFCFGDGSGTACPCGNVSFSGARSGCKNGYVVGATLTAVGIASLSGDTLLLRGDAMPNGPVLFFQGSLRQSGGAGSVFGDGLLCVAGAVTRLAIQTNVSGSSEYPVGVLPTVSALGAATPGTTLHYQGWYRDSSGSCTASGFNVSNGLSVTWAF